jgi:hypothetical protein
MPGDIFGLRTNNSKIYDKQVDNTWQPFGGDYGYVAGGNSVSNYSNILRLDMTSETTSLPGADLHAEKWGVVGNAGKFGYGYFSGGYDPAPGYCTVDRLDFSTETISAPGNNFPTAFNRVFTVSNPEYGYVQNPGPTFRRIDFTTDSISSPPSNTELTQNRSEGGSVFNENYGYFCGGAGDVCTVDRLDFSTESIAVPPGNSQLSLNRRGIYSTQSAGFGYLAGGSMPYNYSCIVDRLDFTTEVVNQMGPQASASHNPAYPLYPATREGAGGMYNASNGYFAGGRNYIYSTEISSVTRMDFTTETTSFATNLPQKRTLVCGISGLQKRIRQTKDATNTNVGGYGFYYVGGYPAPESPGQGNIVDYATETRTTKSELSSGYGEGSGFTTQQYGYHMGANTTVVKRYDFLNDTVNDNPALPSSVYGQGSSTSNYGYICNSNNTPNLDGNKYDFSTETLSMVPDVISVTRFATGHGCFTSSRYVHFTGGPPSNYTHMDRLEFATETKSPLNAGGPTKFQKNSTTGCRSNDCGYSMGGNPGYQNTVDKIEFENDTISDAGTFSPLGRSNGALAVSKNYGYFCMGLRVTGPSPSWRRNRMDRYDFSTSTNVNPPTTFANNAIRGNCMPQDVAV